MGQIIDTFEGFDLDELAKATDKVKFNFKYYNDKHQETKFELKLIKAQAKSLSLKIESLEGDHIELQKQADLLTELLNINTAAI